MAMSRLKPSALQQALASEEVFTQSLLITLSLLDFEAPASFLLDIRKITASYVESQ